ncbi:MAG TPA: hypothetical protein DCR12_01310 [Lachnospiraceae bacterium]|nr:hypothetical protein [Lachnospiraceae bacterium]
MYHAVLLIEVVNILVLAIITMLLFVKFNSRMHLYLILSCMALIVNNVGYQLEIQAQSLDTYLVALKFSYTGRIWIGYTLFIFIAELCRVRVPVAVRIVAVIFNIIMYPIIFTVENNTLYYSYIHFETKDNFPIIDHGRGPFYYVYILSIVVYIIAATYFIIKAHRREKNIARKKQIRVVAFAILVIMAFYIIEVTHALEITRIFDITTIGYTLGSIVFLIAILKYNLLDSATVARQFALDELASCSFIAFDENGAVTYYNKPTKKLFPMIEKDPDTVVDILEEHLELEEPIEIDKRMYVARRENLGEENNSVGTIYLVNDETDYYQYLEDMRVQKEIADEANKAKSNFLANMSHEIRSPINAILGMDEMIIRESSEDDIVGYASDIKTSSQTLLSIVNDILDFSKVEEGKMEIIPTEYEVGDMISNLISMVSERFVNKGLRFKVIVDERIPRVLYGDEIRIKQCILNLLTNAVKYTKEGEVEFRVVYDDISDDEIALKVMVRDTGIGMKEEDMDKLLSPFTRIEERRNRNIEGTGLGMTITAKLLQLMGSRLEVDSVYGKGSTFSFMINQRVVSSEPIGDFYAKSLADKNSVPKYQESFHAPDGRILVIDDTEINLAVITNLLKKTKLTIDTAPSAKQGIELLEKNHYDVVLIDHMMPEMDGIQALHYMRDNDLVPNSKCVVLTANAVSGVREMYMSEGFDDYLSKPVNPEVLEQRLVEWLPKDKIIVDIEDEEAQDEAKRDKILGISEIDEEKGIAYCGSKDAYLSVINIFHETAEDKANEIRKNYEENDWENFTINVHALKSSARVIGAKELSEKAKKMEEAGKRHDIDEINRDIDSLLEDYRSLNDKLKVLDKKDDDSLMEFTESMKKDAFNTMIEIANSMDYGMMETLLDDLKSYRLSDEDDKIIKNIRKMLLELDWDGISEELNNVR